MYVLLHAPFIFANDLSNPIFASMSTPTSAPNFWKEIPRPAFILAPMEDVTDTAFRELVLKISNPKMLHVLFTEFTSVEGMAHPVGRKKVTERLIVSQEERELLQKSGVKLVAQIWGKTPEHFKSAAEYICSEYDFDGIDINMGCPVKNVVKNGCCSALIGTPELAKEIVLATKEGSSIPVSVKTRTGLKEHVTEKWMETLISVNPAALTLHARTQKMQSEKPAEWGEIAKAVAVRNHLAPHIPFYGNGDVFSVQKGLDYTQTYGVDGVMIGRGIFQDPWFFNEQVHTPDESERMKTLLDHVRIFERNWNDQKNFNILKRFFKIYVRDFNGASTLRAQLMETRNPGDVYRLLSAYTS